ncbi:MAG: zinc ribbon domain-containing protein [Oscillospiraceae bacterium]|nr:zinc ribbon domain-containing protein [Oscillospiraceae bacterium]
MGRKAMDIFMYCKNCGRQLKEGMRFCDRCGQSVRKNKESSQAIRRREIEELKAERLNRKKRLAEKEKKQAMSKKRKKKKNNPFMFFMIIVLIAIASILIGYNIFPDNDTINLPADSSGGTIQTPIPATASSSSNLKSGYSEITVANITCPYPSAFHSNTTSGNEKLNLTDSLGGASMIVSQEAKSGEPKDLMKEYIIQIGASDDSETRAGSEYYYVTAEANGTMYHRKCIVRNGLAVYYDFNYDVTSSTSSKYKDYISYIDSNFN